MRIKFCYSLLVFVTLLVSHASAQQTGKVTTSGIGYMEYLPQGYNTNTNKYPIVISLHGKGEKGTSSTDPKLVLADLYKVTNVSLSKMVKYGAQFPFILISPQLKSDQSSWSPSYVMSVINHVKKYLRIDERRIYLTGFSLGGGGVWKTAAAYPTVFAAIAPMCGGVNAASQACAIASNNIATWAFHGDKDNVVSYKVSLNMVNAINACSPKPNPLAKITIFAGMGHYIWDKAYKETNVLNWMLSFTKGTTSSSTNTPPSVSAGSDKTITLPTNVVYLQGSASDPDGIASYQWSKVSGSTASLSGATTSKLKAYNLVAGTYVFRLKVKDNKGASSYDDVKVVVKSSTTNSAPIANAGSDKIITLPTNEVYIQGSGSDKDGSIASYQWTKIKGGTASLSGTSTSKLRAYNLVEGSYVFRLTVKDDKGATDYDDMLVKVQGSTLTASSTSTSTSTSNQSPVANAGPNIILKVPASETYVQGKGTDTDGYITSYQWTKIKGGTASLSGTTSSRLRVYNMKEGAYVFRLTVKDNKGATSYDDMLIRIDP